MELNHPMGVLTLPFCVHCDWSLMAVIQERCLALSRMKSVGGLGNIRQNVDFWVCSSFCDVMFCCTSVSVFRTSLSLIERDFLYIRTAQDKTGFLPFRIQLF